MNIKETLNVFTENLVDAIKTAIEEASNQVTKELADELGHLSLRDLIELADGSTKGGKPGRKAAGRPKNASTRLPRRSAEEIDAAADKLASLLGRKKDGMRAEEIRSALKMDPRELPRVIKAALASKKIAVLSGQKRSTTYGIKAKVAKAKKAKPVKKTGAKSKSKTGAKSKANGIATAPASA
jgi:hypothetical protein